MEQQDRNTRLKEFIDNIDRIIRTKKVQQVQKYLTSIEEFEDEFLENYKRRKKEGVYYTDPHISSYISREALIFFINSIFEINNTNSLPIHSIDEIYSLNAENQQKINNALMNVTICDPACGSGRFLLSSVEIIFYILETLNPKKSKSELRLTLIRNLHGYDISTSAISLTILKLLRWILEENSINISQIYFMLKSNFKSINSLINSDIGTYDIILGNPPYGNILDNSEKKILKEKNIFYKDIYCSFLLKSLDWGKNIIGFLVPKSFLLRQGYVEFRNQLLKKANILKIVDIGSKLFKNATNEVQIIFYENKGHDQSWDLKVYDYPESNIISYENQETSF